MYRKGQVLIKRSSGGNSLSVGDQIKLLEDCSDYDYIHSEIKFTVIKCKNSTFLHVESETKLVDYKPLKILKRRPLCTKKELS